MAVSKKVAYTFDPFEIAGVDRSEIPADKRAEIRQEVGDFVVESILSRVGGGRSPVRGEGKFKKLSKDYKSFKTGEGSGGDPNLELTGDMLDSLDFVVEGSKIRVGVSPSEAPKADNHNHFKEFGSPTLPRRQFIPKEDQTFTKDIISGIRDIIDNIVESD